MSSGYQYQHGLLVSVCDTVLLEILVISIHANYCCTLYQEHKSYLTVPAYCPEYLGLSYYYQCTHLIIFFADIPSVC